MVIPVALLCASIAVLVVRTEPNIIVFTMLAAIPSALVWWVMGWTWALIYFAAYLAFRALRRAVHHAPPEF